jgi:hypothetical protein
LPPESDKITSNSSFYVLPVFGIVGNPFQQYLPVSSTFSNKSQPFIGEMSINS